MKDKKSLDQVIQERNERIAKANKIAAEIAKKNLDNCPLRH